MLPDGENGNEQIDLLHIGRQLGDGLHIGQFAVDFDHSIDVHLREIASGEHIEKSGLASTTRSHDGNRRARTDITRHILNDLHRLRSSWKDAESLLLFRVDFDVVPRQRDRVDMSESVAIALLIRITGTIEISTKCEAYFHVRILPCSLIC